jgi:hypothetical protein
MTGSRNEALQTARDAEADIVVLVRTPGLLHPDSLAALVEMSEAQDGAALLAARCFPEPAVDADPATGFAMSAATGPVVAIPRAVADRLGGFDERLRGDHADLDFSWRATAHGFAIRCCPRALFLAAPEEWPVDPASGALLAEKWGNAAARAHFAGLLAETGRPMPPPHPEPVPAEWCRFADFAEQLRGTGR